jgi:hypothetical protein
MVPVEASELGAHAAVPLPTQAINAAMGKQGQMMKGGVFQFSLGREDVKPRMMGFEVESSNALSLETWFKSAPAGAMVMGEIPLRESEVNGTLSRLFANNLMVTAIHNHRIELAPHVMWIHFSGMGDAATLARGLRASLPPAAQWSSGAPAPQKTPLPAKNLGAILGGDTTIQDEGVVEVSVERRDQVRMMGMVIPPTMGVSAEIYFQPLGGGRANVTVEAPLHGNEVNPFVATLRAQGLVVSALHNHMIGENPRLFYVHAAANGQPINLAERVRVALNRANFKPSQAGKG